MCRAESIEQARFRNCTGMSDSSSHRYVLCECCGNRYCAECIRGVYDYIHRYSSIPSYVKEHDVTCKVISAMHSLLSFKGESSVPDGPCCSFRNSISENSKASTTRPPRPPLMAGHNNADAAQSKSDSLRNWRRNVHKQKVHESSLEYLSHYHSCVSPKVEILRPAVMLN